MSEKRPEDLRLADELDAYHTASHHKEAAAEQRRLHTLLEAELALHQRTTYPELRRLHAENESLRQIVQDFPPVEAELREVSDRAHRLEQQRDALLEALNSFMYEFGDKANSATVQKARAAIKAVKEQ